MTLNPPTQAFPFATAPIDIAKLLDFEHDCELQGFIYGDAPGKKLPLGVAPLSLPHGTATDCSGFARAAVYWATDGKVDIADGSWVEHENIIKDHFKESTPAAGALHDGAVRIGFLSPGQHGTWGHVVLIYMGMTLESCGSHGPCRREWGEFFWMSEMQVYVLTPPLQAAA